MSLQLLLVADSDSQLLACQALARCTDDQDVQVTVNAIPREGTPAAVLAALARIGPVWSLGLRQLLADPRLDQFDAIGVYLTGSKLAEFRSHVPPQPPAAATTGAPPVLRLQRRGAGAV